MFEIAFRAVGGAGVVVVAVVLLVVLKGNDDSAETDGGKLQTIVVDKDGHPAGGGSVTYDLPASIEGVFEAELEGHKEQIVEMTVSP